MYATCVKLYFERNIQEPKLGLPSLQQMRGERASSCVDSLSLSLSTILVVFSFSSRVLASHQTKLQGHGAAAAGGGETRVYDGLDYPLPPRLFVRHGVD